MSDQTRPNLFSYATSELSQDAFICWLAAWADPKWKESEPALHRMASAFIISMIRKEQPSYDSTKIKTVEVSPQVEKLDILIEINKGDPADKLAILVEDKTHTSNHSDQLNRYYKQVNDSGYDINQMIPLYFKTGYQSKFDTLGIFKTYLRSDFLPVLQEGKNNGVANHIFADFLIHLEEMDAAIRHFSNRHPTDWGNNDWRGFFMALYDAFGKLDDGANWNYIANPKGGFFGFWWYFRNLDEQSYTPYLQLENDELCFKIEVIDETKRQKAREETYYKLIKANNQLQLGVGVKRPNRMGSGRYMTVLRWEGDYLKSKDGKLDFDATLENLKKAQQILDLAFPK